METTSHMIEITVISGEDLFLSRRQRVSKNAFVIIKTDESNFLKTNMDKDGGSNPAWNEKLIMNISTHARYLTVEVHCKTSSGNKIVGAAKIPTSDFLGGYAPHGYLHFLSYRLSDSMGERNGIVNISVRVKMEGKTASGYDVSDCSRPWMGVGVPVDETLRERYTFSVTGVPAAGFKY